MAEMPEDIILDVKDLKQYFPIHAGFFQKVVGNVKAVDGVTFSLRKGEVLGLVGESGCGKTTTGRSILAPLRSYWRRGLVSQSRRQRS